MGAHWDGRGVDFALHAVEATAVHLCLFERPESREAQRVVALDRHRDGVFRCRLEGLGPGTLYGYRVEGAFAPRQGLRFNRSKLLVDPYARAITGEPRYSSSLLGHLDGDGEALRYNPEDSAGEMPKCVVVDPAFDWQGVSRPGVPWRETVIYECHVKGMTQRHPQVDGGLRGTYLGLAQPAVIDHWRRLGVTSVQLLPVHQIASEMHLLARNQRNYWGYSSLGHFAPHAAYASGDGTDPQRPLRDFKGMVQQLHRAGLEVLLDVVYNHSPEGDHLGPTLSWRGIDNRGVYRLPKAALHRYTDFTGCGNSIDIHRPAVRRWILDSLRYWATDMQVDGFRFDLATFLGRDPLAFSSAAPIFEEISRDPVLAPLKWIAEPWDLGPGGYRLGQFPDLWREWNDRYRIEVRRFWRGYGATAAHLARRLSGSDDAFLHKGYAAGINYVVSHDGFTLVDLVSYAKKHNEANGEGNRDGSSDDTSSNWGHEGETDDVAIQTLRRRTRRNLIATLAWSRGTPMVAQGDELGHSQRGNNNPYCQDNDTTWLDWSPLATAQGAAFHRFVQRVLTLRRTFPILQDLDFLSPDQVTWLTPEGSEMGAGDWQGEAPSLGMLLHANLLLVFHGAAQSVQFQLPPGSWWQWIDTAQEEVVETPLQWRGRELEMQGFSLRLLSRSAEGSKGPP